MLETIKKTDQEMIETIPKAKNVKVPKLSEIDKKKIGDIMTRYQDMMGAKSKVSRTWGLYLKQYDAGFTPSPTGESRSNVPLEYAIIQHYLSDARKLAPNFPVKSAWPVDYQKLQKVRKAWKYHLKNDGINTELDKDELNRAIFGTSILMSYYDRSERVVKDLVNADKMEYEENVIIKQGVRTKSIDIRSFFVDNNAKSMDDAVDCIYITTIPYSEFLTLKNNPYYRDIDSVKPWQTNEDYKSYVTKEEEVKRDSVELLTYYNKFSDEEVTIANRSIIIKETPLLNPNHELPFTRVVLNENVNSFWGRGFCELCQVFKHEINTLRDMLMEAVKRSNNQQVILGGGLDIDDIAYDNTVIRANGILQGNIETISGNPPNQAGFNYLESKWQEISMFVGVNLLAIVSSSSTAYQTAVQQEMSTKVIKNILNTRNRELQRWSKIHFNLFRKYFPWEAAEYMYPLSDPTVKPAYVPLEKESLNKYGDFEASTEDSFFEMSDADIRGDYTICVETDFSAPLLQSTKQETTAAGINAIIQLEQAALSSELLGNNKFVLSQQISEDFNLGLDIETTNPVLEAQKAELKRGYEVLSGLMPEQAQWAGKMAQDTQQWAPYTPENPLSQPNKPTL